MSALTTAATSVNALHLGGRTRAAIALVSAVGLIAFTWPLLAAPESTAMAHASDAPWLFAILVPMLLILLMAEISDGALDAKSIALLGVLSAVIAALRPLGGGIAGLEPIWAVLILGGRALGPAFGFTLGSVSLFASALLTGGVGPWLPFQMMGAAWVGLGAGLLPRATGKRELFLLAGYGAIASLAYGLLLNLWFWPFIEGLAPAISFIPGAGIGTNALAWLRFDIVTSLGYDIPRAVLTVLLILIAGRPVLLALRRVGRRASFQAAPTFVATPAGDPDVNDPDVSDADVSDADVSA